MSEKALQVHHAGLLVFGAVFTFLVVLMLGLNLQVSPKIYITTLSNHFFFLPHTSLGLPRHQIHREKERQQGKTRQEKENK